MKIKKLITSILTLLILFLCVTGCDKKKTIDEIVLASAGDTEIYLRDFLYYFNFTRENQDNYLENTLGFTTEKKIDYWKNNENGKSLEEELKEYTLDILKYQATILKISKENNIKIDKNDLKEKNKQVENFITSLNSIEKTGDKVLFDKYKIMTEDLKNIQKDMLMIESYVNSITDKISVSEEEILAFYKKNKELVEKNVNMKVKVKHILIKSNENMSEKENKKAEELANDLLKRIQNGEDIGKLAKEYSEDKGSCEKDGEYTFGRGEMVKKFEDWAFNSNIGDKGIVKTQYGFHVIELIEKPSFDDLYEKIKEYITTYIKQEEGFKIIDKEIKEKNMDWKINEEVYNSVKIEYPEEEKGKEEKGKEEKGKEEKGKEEDER